MGESLSREFEFGLEREARLDFIRDGERHQKWAGLAGLFRCRG
jgi:hypothetical protein